ncbi:glutathione S-transferase family protein [Marinibactrum halimedae]|uniref:Glutathione S-transferase n=1 Tax=Marinibactrum halimedae TaxID=1444977 RepID=A0AA37T744_9GAMM|nr:glutathione S-transferase family protein [Marinibactrum halimedae]MCD9457938.1 glutathione S-transferase family protein [Marinibactrum halimedae]GLS26233.1 glutathione S-transferase [Marinibactrum halimedae]
MKIYESRQAPNPRRVRIFLAEKQIDMTYVQLDLAAGENLTPEMRKKNPTTKIPFLELDDGTFIGETVAICRYFEEIQPEPPLFGRTPLEKAQVEMWARRVEFHMMMPVGMCFQHTTGYFKDRMTPVPSWGEVCGDNAKQYLIELNDHLASNPYLVDNYFSIADINLFCAIDFAKVINIRIDKDESFPHLLRWYKNMKQRPSVSV